MKKFTRAIVLLALAMVMSMTLASCGGGIAAADLYGQWSDDEDATAVLEFYDDGSYMYSWFDEYELSWTGFYTVSGGKIAVTDHDYPEEAAVNSNVSISGSTLTIGRDSIIGGTYQKIN